MREKEEGERGKGTHFEVFAISSTLLLSLSGGNCFCSRMHCYREEEDAMGKKSSQRQVFFKKRRKESRGLVSAVFTPA